MPIAELFLGAFLQVLFDRLASPRLLNFARREGIDKLLNKWDKWLTSIDQVLVDAEDRQLTGDRRVKSWLEDLRDLAYDIEDLLDEFATESADNKPKAKTSTSKARSLLPSCCFRLSPRAIMLDHKMRSEIEDMDRRLQEIITQKNSLSLRENNGQQSAHCRLDKLLPTTHLSEPCFVSREVEKMEILRSLIGEEDNGTCADLQVIPIVGMGGVGKTALAQQVYNDARVTSCFEKKAWACVSYEFDVLAITKRILEATNGQSPCEGKDLDWLQDKLKENLSGKKFLVVLDDVWNEKYGHWTSLLKPLQSGAKGSKIIVTTRNHRVASIAGAPPKTLEELPLDACMTLFAFHAFGVENFDQHLDLEVLGRKIVEKCKGLPLAVKTLAGMLRTEVNPHTWEAILNSKIWDLPEERNEILPALKLSYLHLPSNLRRCFAYCAIFPKDYEIQRDELIRWWIAEGLVEGKEGKNRWNAGLDYYNELVSRSLFQKSSSHGSRFLMHDLVNDLAKLVAGATYFDSGELEGDHKNASLTRHASFIPSSDIMSKRLKIYHRMQGLRSFISLEKKSGYYDRSFLSQQVLADLLSELKYLRVLSLSCYYISEVPNCISRLRHLRHLNLSYTNIETLPKSVAALYNLEALILRGCYKLVELPEDLEKLINLRFLDITDTPSLRAMPLCIGNLVGLEMLSKFIVQAENGSRLKELKSLGNLEGELCISDLHMVQEAKDANDACLHTKKGLCRLTMRWTEDFAGFRNEELEAKVLDFLRPHKNLENLAISYYGGLQFPLWLGSPSHVNIVRLRLHGCCRAKALPSLGQLSSLEELVIEGLNAIRTVGQELYGTKYPFPSLITLEFKDMPLWEDWSHYFGTEEVGVVFPRLEHLVIKDCPKLIGRLPSQLNSLTKLEIDSCPRMDATPSIISLPSLNELKFGGCKEGVLKSLVNMASLTALVIEDVVDLTCINHGFTSSLIKLEKLEMKSCKELMYLWQDRNVIRDLGCLKSLVVRSCPGLVSLAAGEEDIELPVNLETMEVASCVNLEKLPSKMHTLSSLRDLAIEKCPKLASFPETGIPTSVISLRIRDCEMLQSLPIIGGLSSHPEEPSSSSSRNNHVDLTSCLQEIRIWGCDSLPASPFSEGRFLPATLKRLAIGGCRGVESLAEINVDRLQSLQEISINDCENLRSLPQGLHTLSHLTILWLECPALELECFPPLPPGITSFRLEGCPKIKALPNQLLRLTCLRDLSIGRCESVTRFPDGGLPPQLQELRVWECGNMKQPVREWLTPLTSLQLLEIDGSSIGGGGGVGEEEDLVLPLPSSLLYLHIASMPNLERLSITLPPSLRNLWIYNCLKLRELPKDEDGHGHGHGLPPSLEWLMIRGCPILEEGCRKGTGCYWPLIRHIPQVTLGNMAPIQSITT
ncbi:putative disease resistance RPP13-like protein 1 [Rhodamnia argentea]|uniref:Disease resistance RPP13-like protein 1 n=1 Tax=Rhodamnia argentea TaxID=178133 RepID=A0ABM3HIT0_9MYRT|nr:putative disease resistance RPP13-like protein 1 [Rhodamnia argentea]